MKTITIYYDSHCPLCMAEMLQLKSYDQQGQICFADLHAENFTDKYPHIDRQKAYDRLHVELENGEILLGLDASCKIWNTVGKHRWLKLLRLPLIKQVSDIFYTLFAKYREPISLLLTGSRRCSSCDIEQAHITQEKQL